MIVKVIEPMSGPRGSWGRGDPYECDDAEGGRLIAAGYASPFEAETAVVSPAAATGARGRGRTGTAGPGEKRGWKR